jgi:AcrR family transcriptional regulator
VATFQKLPEEVRRQQILEAAAHAFSTDGYDKVSMARIAADAGLTKGGVYFHFSSKEEVFTAMVETELGQRWGTLQQLADELDEVPAAEALQRLIGWWFALDQGPNLLSPPILAACIAMDRPRAAFTSQVQRVTDLLSEVIGRLMEELDVDSDPDELAELLMMLRVGAIWKDATSDEQERERFHQRATDVLGRVVTALVTRR